MSPEERQEEKEQVRILWPVVLVRFFQPEVCVDWNGWPPGTATRRSG
jgi:hypothetical protein